MKTVNLIIKGKVQGVFFRQAAKEQAEKLGITGWVKNISEGRVEVMATGEEARLEDFVEWCHVGPRRANVEDVIITPLSEQKFDEFTVIRESYPYDV